MEVILTGLIILAVIVLFVLPKVLKSPQKNAFTADIFKQLSEIKRQLETPEASIRRDLVVKLDTLMCKSLKNKYGKGACGENLKKANKVFERKVYNDIWESHKLRNRVVHENVEVSPSQLKDAYDIFKVAISKLLA